MTGRTRRLLARYVPETVRGRLGLGPDFLIIGAQKGGTTSLYDALSDHPCVAGALKKEIQFFDLNYHRGIGWYRAHFPSMLERRYTLLVTRKPFVTGEASPSYLFHPLAPQRMREVAPQAKLIALLRNPADRAYSHYWHEVRRGRETLPFAEAIEVELRGEGKKRPAYLARGRYLEQLQRLETHFPRQQTLVLQSEALYADPARTYRAVLEFLGLPRWEPRQFRTLNTGSYPPMEASARQRLAAYFRPHNERLARYLGVDLGWA